MKKYLVILVILVGILVTAFGISGSVWAKDTTAKHDMQKFLTAIKNDSGLETTFNEISAEGMSISIVKK
jgi:hypothetical protein